MNLFLSVGAMKAGTTWLYSVLEKHPDLYFTPEKEIHFLNHHYVNNSVLRDEYRLNQAKNRLKPDATQHIGVYRKLSRWYAMYLENPKDFSWYERLFSLNRQKMHNCDFSNLSCHLEEKHWRDILQKYPKVKILYIIREPVSRLWSHTKFHHQFAGRDTSFVDWSESDFKFFLKKKFIWENSIYSTYIERMKSVFGEDQFKLIFFEDISTEPRRYLYELEDFLGIQHIDYPLEKLNKKVNVSKSIQMPDSFRNISNQLVQPEIERLEKLGIEIPLKWRQ